MTGFDDIIRYIMRTESDTKARFLKLKEELSKAVTSHTEYLADLAYNERSTDGLDTAQRVLGKAEWCARYFDFYAARKCTEVKFRRWLNDILSEFAEKKPTDESKAKTEPKYTYVAEFGYTTVGLSEPQKKLLNTISDMFVAFHRKLWQVLNDEFNRINESSACVCRSKNEKPDWSNVPELDESEGCDCRCARCGDPDGVDGPDSSN